MHDVFPGIVNVEDWFTSFSGLLLTVDCVEFIHVLYIIQECCKIIHIIFPKQEPFYLPKARAILENLTLDFRVQCLVWYPGPEVF